jgi:hypothetical protein
MAITKFLDPAQMPARTQDQQKFDNMMAAFMQDLPVAFGQINATEAGMNSIAAGGAYAIPQVFNTAYAGNHNGGHALMTLSPQNTATSMALDGIDVAGKDWGAMLASIGGVTSATKAWLRMYKQNDPTKFLAFRVTSLSYYGTYGDMVLVPSGASGANPFAHGDAIVLLFTPNGDKGDTGPAGSQLTNILHVREEYAYNTAGPALSSSGSNRAFNTVVANTITNASLGANIVTLPAGTYDFYGWAVAACSAQGHRAMLRNVTASNTSIIWGNSEYNNSGSSMSMKSILQGRFTLSVQSQLTLVDFVSNSGQLGGLSSGTGTGSPNEVYSEMIFRKVA